MPHTAAGNPPPADGRVAAPLDRLAWFAGLLTAAVMVLRWPYRGVRHDAMLYLGQALSHRDPAWARNDLYFAYGSQDQFTVFGRLLAALIDPLGIARAEMLLLIAGLALGVGAIVMLARHLPGPARWFAPVVVVASSHFYAHDRVFSYLEPFLTARSWAEPLALVALLLLMRGRLALALLALLASAACHPLVAIPAALVGWTWLILRDRRWAWAALLAVPVAALSVAGVRPFSALAVCYDDTWFHITIIANPAVFISMWTSSELLAAAGTVGLLWWAGRTLDGALADLCRAAAIATVVLCLVSFLGADFWHDVLITQLQLWRVLWIATLLATLVLWHLLGLLFRRGAAGQLAAASLVLGVLSSDASVPNGWALTLWAAMAVALVQSGRLDHAKPRILRLATLGIAAAAVLLSVTQAVNVASQLKMRGHGMAIDRAAWIPVTLTLLTVSVAAGLWWLYRSGGLRRRVAVGVTVLLLAVGAAGWDQRTAWQRYVEDAPPGSHPFAALVPPGAQVEWDREVLPPWLLLQRPSYFTSAQAAGVLFNRGNAMAVAERLLRAQAFVTADSRCRNLEWAGFRADQVEACSFPRQAFLDLCAVKGSGPPADFIIAPEDVGVPPVAQWTFRPGDGHAPTTWRLFDCKRLPQGAATAQSVTPAPR